MKGRYRIFRESNGLYKLQRRFRRRKYFNLFGPVVTEWVDQYIWDAWYWHSEEELLKDLRNYQAGEKAKGSVREFDL